MLVHPEKGAAAFWMDLTSDQTIESEAVHAGCPVLVGSKWILNKWVYAFDQWKKYPCLLKKWELMPPLKGVTN